MKKLVYALAALAIFTVGCSKGDKGGSNSNAYGYGVNGGCYMPGTGYPPPMAGYPGAPVATPYMGGGAYYGGGVYAAGGGRYANQNMNGGYGAIYQYRGDGQCFDIRRNVQVAQRYCDQNGYRVESGFNPSYMQANGQYCGGNYFGGYPTMNYGMGYGNGAGYSNMPSQNICSKFDRPELGLYTMPIVYPGTGQVKCVEYSTFSNASAPYGVPQYAGGSNMFYQGCVPGAAGTTCNCSSMNGSLGTLQGGVSAGVCF